MPGTPRRCPPGSAERPCRLPHRPSGHPSSQPLVATPPSTALWAPCGCRSGSCWVLLPVGLLNLLRERIRVSSRTRKTPRVEVEFTVSEDRRQLHYQQRRARTRTATSPRPPSPTAPPTRPCSSPISSASVRTRPTPVHRQVCDLRPARYHQPVAHGDAVVNGTCRRSLAAGAPLGPASMANRAKTCPDI